MAANGLGFTTEQAAAEVNALKRLFVLASELPVQEVWEHLVVNHRVEGKNTYDARLVATMLVHGIEGLLTLNTQDFLRYGEIRVLDAAKIAGL